MNREESQMVTIEIVAYAGDARSKLLTALNKAKDGEFDKSYELVEEANELILKAHQVQTDLITADANGEDVNVDVLMVHGQDHLMTCILLKDLTKHLIELYKKGV